MVVDLLLQDREGAGGRVVARLAAGDGGDADQGAGAEDEGALERQADDDGHRAVTGRGRRVPAILAGAKTVGGEIGALGGGRDFGVCRGISGGRDRCGKAEGKKAERERAPQPGGTTGHRILHFYWRGRRRGRRFALTCVAKRGWSALVP